MIAQSIIQKLQRGKMGEKTKERKKEDNGAFETFYKGSFMGIAEAIPGISGGSIALIVGIYERLISAIKSIDFKFIPYFFISIWNRKYLKKTKDDFLSIDFSFLLPLVAGMGLAFLGAIIVIGPALEKYPAYIYSFFFGLILASAGVVYGRIGESNFRAFLAGIAGFLFAFLFVGLGKNVLGHANPIIFLSGFIAICAMILPGVSGAFMLLFLGQYEYMINALLSIRTYWIEVGTFMAGALLSLFLVSRPLSYALKKYRASTMFFLTGLMIGALRLPYEEVMDSPTFLEDPTITLGVVLIGGLGFFMVVFIQKAST